MPNQYQHFDAEKNKKRQKSDFDQQQAPATISIQIKNDNLSTKNR